MRNRRITTVGPLFIALGLTGTLGTVCAATPATMQAMVADGTGGPESLKLEMLPVPSPGAGQALVRVYAASVNPVDWKRMGPAGGSAKPELRIPGRDVAGVIERVGPGVTRFKVGDPVFGEVAPLPGIAVNGAYAQFAVAPIDDLAPKPKRLSYAQASGLGIATVTGVRAVLNSRVMPGQRVLVTGAAGGVGSAAVQAAKAHGAYVIGTAAARHAAYLKNLGIDESVDYTAGDWSTRVQNIDVVIDTVSAENATQALRTMKRGGTLLYVAGRAEPAACAAAGVDCQGGALGAMSVASAAGGATAPGATGGSAAAPGAAAVNPVIDDILRLANAGKLTVVVDASYPLAQATAAQQANRAGGTQGKIVLIVDAGHAGRK